MSSIPKQITLVEFLGAARRIHRSGRENGNLLAPIADPYPPNTPVVLPQQYLGAAVDDNGTAKLPVGIWLPFRRTLFFCSAAEGDIVSTGTAIAVVSKEETAEELPQAKKLALSHINECFAGQPIFDDLRQVVWAASNIILSTVYFAWDGGAGPMEIEYGGHMFLFANKQKEWIGPPLLFPYTPRIVDDEQDRVFKDTIMGGGLNTMISCMELLSCKNISMQTETEVVTRKQQRHGKVGFEWKTIVVVPGYKKQNTGSQTGIPLSALPRLHECRAHFKEYSREKPLFGKVGGKFFWHQHMRGSDTLGAIGHEKYEIKGGPNK